jgi:hypothetical protein
MSNASIESHDASLATTKDVEAQARRQKGCVIRAIQSALGVEATDQEWDARLDTMEQILSSAEKLRGKVSQIALLMAVARAEDRAVRVLLDQMSRNNSPLGAELRKYDLREEYLLRTSIPQRLGTGEKLLLSVQVLKDRQRHLAHVGLRHGELVSLSDGNRKIRLQPGAYHAYVLTRKPE